jgi:sugar O-acyltransferase (sialic acid O-acetyltransferase NeuD family)
MIPILVFGASQHTRYTIDTIESEKKYKVHGILDATLRQGETFEGYPVLGADEDLPEIVKKSGITRGIISIGDNYIRKIVSEKILDMVPDFEFVTTVHPMAMVGKNTTVGPGTLIMVGVIVNNNCSIGSHCFLATKSSFDHDSVMGDYTSLSAGVTSGGGVMLGSVTAIMMGVVIIHGRRVGSNVVIGAGSVVIKDIPDNCVAYGSPARYVRSRKINDKYL